MKVLLVNGSPNEKGCTYTALQEVARTLEKEGIETEFFWIGKKAVSQNDQLPGGDVLAGLIAFQRHFPALHVVSELDEL